MPVSGLELCVPDHARATDLFVDLVGGVSTDGASAAATTRSGGATQPGDAMIRWRETAAPRARLRMLEVRVNGADRAVAALPASGTSLHPHGDGWTFTAKALGVDVLVLDAEPADDTPDRSGHEPGSGAAGVRHFDHVCFAVESLAEALDLLHRRLGGSVVFGGHNRELGTLSSQVSFGPGTRVELLQPTRPDAALRQFLDRHGPGLHHLTWHVHDVEVAARAARDHGFAVVDTDLGRRTHWRETYLRPSSALGLLVQLAWTDRHHDTALDDDTVAAILAGEVDSWGYTMRPAARRLPPTRATS